MNNGSGAMRGTLAFRARSMTPAAIPMPAIIGHLLVLEPWAASLDTARATEGVLNGLAGRRLPSATSVGRIHSLHTSLDSVGTSIVSGRREGVHRNTRWRV